MTSTEPIKSRLGSLKRAWLLAPVVVFVVSGYGLYAWLNPGSDGETALATVVESVERNYSTISHMPPARLQQTLDAGATQDMVVFDVREPDEFKVSHIAGARRVDPSISTADFMNRFADQVRGKKVVFYCSVGVRSSRLADALRTKLASVEAREVYNLKGGIFGWHNKRMSVVNEAGQTDLVHPFDERWGRLVVRADKRSYTPRPN